MSTKQIRDAAHTVVNGGVGFVPLPPHCQKAAKEALRTLVDLGKYRKRMAATWKDEQWGYAPDDKGQYDRGLSQWRADERKDVFHFEPQAPDILVEQGAALGNWSHFFRPCAFMYQSLSALGLRCAEEFDRILPGYGFAQSCKDAESMDALRLLAYERRTHGLTAATSHRDRDFLSIHVFETAPGLFVGHEEGSRVRVSGTLGYAAIFAGRKFEQMTGGRVKALWHGTEEVPQLEPKGRRAVVFFKHTNMALIRDKGELERQTLL